MASLEPARLGALTCIASIPILCIGFDAMLQKTASLVHQKSLIIPAFVSTVFCYCASYFDAVDKCKQIFNGVICQSVDELIGSGDAGIYSINEKAFVARVLEEVDNDSVIVNCPDDGSAFAYADDDANVL